MSAITLAVEVTRGQSVESVHRAVGVVCSGTEGAESCVGDPILLTFWRSAMKPFQTLPLIEDGVVEAFDFGMEEIALACASHGGTDAHVEVVGRMLGALRIDSEALHCGAQAPFDPDSAFRLRCAGREPGRIHNNCSGKHAGMLALARHHGWDADGYWRLDHPVQGRILTALKPWMDIDPEAHEWALDGCGVPTPRLPLREMARAYARLVSSARDGRPDAAAVVRAMTERPDLTSSPGRAPLVLMEATDGRLLAKEGAEGVLCLASIEDDWGMAVKVEDGGLRAVGPAVVAVLEEADMITKSESRALEALQDYPIRNTLGAEVGRVRARVTASEGIPGRTGGSERAAGGGEQGP
ncbi:MAG: asparaginase [marine benthic group bacterium]|jgi:L-asparaginase II|nr:asparaginase [Gemmatimonadota bacterium]MCL7963707.1 asparaginase [Candidatus Carthagonibacter metallireducens]MCL7937894.1 asparaginase [Gemmatimonadota bacterium]MCL7958484.1 asparaginase [Gemmatimonadota bacterium]MCL7965193.1 asparaginase [Gemmatimonadota bacterium]